MADIIKQFLVSIGLTTDSQSFASAARKVDAVETNLNVLDATAIKTSESFYQKLIPSIKGAVLPLTALAASAAYAYKKIFDLVENTAESFEKVDHLANRVNATAEQILKLGYAAQFSRSTVEAAQQSLDGLNRAAGEATLGVGRSRKIFNEIGVSVKDANGHLKNTYDLMLEVGQAIKGMERGKQIAVLQKLGIDPTMIEALTQNVSGLGEEFDKIYKTAGINANQASKTSLNFIESLNKLKFVIKTVSQALGLSLMPELTQAINLFRKWIVDNLPKIMEILKPTLKMILSFGDVVLRMAYIFGEAASFIISFVLKINNALGGLPAKIALVAFAWKKLNIAFLMSPIGRLVALLGIIGLLIDDYQTFERGGKSLINWNSTLTKTIIYLSESLMGLVLALKASRTAMILLDIAMDANPIGLVITAIGALIFAGYELYKHWSAIAAWFTATFDKIGQDIDAVVDKTKAAIGSVGNLYNKTFGAVGNAIGGAAYNLTHHQNINQNTTIMVNGSGNPYETANAVSNTQKRVNGDMARNMRGAVR